MYTKSSGEINSSRIKSQETGYIYNICISPTSNCQLSTFSSVDDAVDSSENIGELIRALRSNNDINNLVLFDINEENTDYLKDSMDGHMCVLNEPYESSNGSDMRILIYYTSK